MRDIEEIIKKYGKQVRDVLEDSDDTYQHVVDQ